MCDREQFKQLLYSGLKQAGVAIVFIAFAVWVQHNYNKQSERYLEVIGELSQFKAQQIEVMRTQTAALEKLTDKIERIATR